MTYLPLNKYKDLDTPAPIIKDGSAVSHGSNNEGKRLVVAEFEKILQSVNSTLKKEQRGRKKIRKASGRSGGVTGGSKPGRGGVEGAKEAALEGLQGEHDQGGKKTAL